MLRDVDRPDPLRVDEKRSTKVNISSIMCYRVTQYMRDS